MKITIVSLLIGTIVGFCAQRSRMCFIGGWRDFFLIRDTYLLKGFFSLLIAAALFFFLMDISGEYVSDYPSFAVQKFEPVDPSMAWLIDEFREQYDGGLSVCEIATSPLLATFEMPVNGLHIGSFILPYNTFFLLICGLIIGFFSTVANGCPVRQHIMAASGNISAMVYLLCFYGGIILYEKYWGEFIRSLN